ncbi:hypothetical protein [Pseudoalteromonas piscicida]|uniref:Uncharacterized protein n=1 Tax=Pseudoalteromonas piscicida TaxID=43662 RepID=A0AAD0RHQ9_PSEO7|nr:hypothetical protein [Pseudoalteromonas piscicida]ASD66311.1 hypothetical protein B1L02_04190 [Pseudoalteromonas piscicida]AXR02982.1 hypothetical protein D0511_13570 [Pseudoalteromonas piscicida]
MLVSALVLRSSAIANISVTVEDAESSRYIPAPLTTLAGKSQDRFDVLSNYPSVVRIVDLEYQFADSGIAPRCHFSNLRWVSAIYKAWGILHPPQVLTLKFD